MVIGALVLTIALLKVRRWFRETFGDSELLKQLDLQKVALYAGAAAFGLLVAGLMGAALAAGILAVALGAVVLAIGLVFGLMAVGAGLVLLPFAIAAGLVYAFVKAIEWLIDTWQATDWGALGTAIVDGLVAGLKHGAKWVINAITDLASSATKAFKAKLRIGSPSKVFAEAGVSGAKYGLWKLGRIENVLRSPMVSVEPATAETIDAAMKHVGLIN